MDRSRRILVIGSNGYIGSNLVFEFKRQGFSNNECADVAASKAEGYHQIDIRLQSSVREVFSHTRPDVVFHLAGISSLDECERDMEKANLVNVVGIDNVANEVASRDGCKLVFMSSDYVFDGMAGGYAEDSDRSPRTYYGRTKVMAEDIITSKLLDYIICRSSNVYGHGGNFYNFIMSKLRAGEQIGAYNNTKYTPTYIGCLTSSLLMLVDRDFRGVIHVAGKDSLSRFEFTKLLAASYDIRLGGLVVPQSRPIESLVSADSSLDTSRLSGMGAFMPGIDRCTKYALDVLKFPYFFYSDDRGIIMGITNDDSYAQMNYCETKAGCVRGNHFHKTAHELFYIISGRVCVSITSPSFVRNFEAQDGDIIVVPPNCVHTLHALYDSKWMNALTTNSSNGDIFTGGIKT